jgi:hypothetical protein
MPTRTVYIDDEKDRYIDELVASEPGIENRSQAVQYCINQQRQREALEE